MTEPNVTIPLPIYLVDYQLVTKCDLFFSVTNALPKGIRRFLPDVVTEW